MSANRYRLEREHNEYLHTVYDILADLPPDMELCTTSLHHPTGDDMVYLPVRTIMDRIIRIHHNGYYTDGHMYFLNQLSTVPVLSGKISEHYDMSTG